MHMAGLSIPLGRWAGMAMLGLGGMFVGMTAAALAELLELMPVLIVRSRVAGLTIPAVIALMLGKALGGCAGSSCGNVTDPASGYGGSAYDYGAISNSSHEHIAQPNMRILAHKADLRCTSPYKSDDASECDKWHPDAPLCCA